jgi:hypothetical protein
MTENKRQNHAAASQWSWNRGAIVVALGMDIFFTATLAHPQGQCLFSTAVFGLLAVLVAWSVHVDRQRHRKWNVILNNLPVPLALASVPGFFQEYAKLGKSIMMISKHNDLLFRDLALTQLEAISNDVAILARGQVVFNATETWRAAYQRVLETMRVKTYYSVAWVRTNDYWNDTPGRQSMRFNYELIGRGFRIERVHILPDELWPFDEKMPPVGILEWLVEQQGRGIIVSLVRESDLVTEPDLLRDFAIYGDRAMGVQELDEQSHTVRFVLSFDEPSIRQALAQWERLKLFSISFQNLVDP